MTFLPRTQLKRWLWRVLPAAAFDTVVVAYWRLRNALPFGYEAELAHLARFVKPGDWVVDVGVNMAQYASALLRLVGREGRVIGFEASPSTCVLSRRIAGAGPMELHNLALGDAARSVVIGSFAGDAGMIDRGFSRVIDGADVKATATETVQCVPMDQVLAGRTHPISFIKCDVEGFEVQVLSGARALLAQDRPVLLVEIQQEEHFRAVTAMLAPLGYSAFQLRAAAWEPVPAFAQAWTNNFLFAVKLPP